MTALESTPFCVYLANLKLVAVIRGPVDRAYSNWMHLWLDGLEPSADFRDAWRQECSGVDAGWVSFWPYR